MLKNSVSKFILALTATTCLLGTSTIYAKNITMNLFYDGKTHKYSEEEVKIKVDGKEISNLDVPPIIINERTMVPARAVFEALGADVAWNEATKEVYMTKGSDLVVLKIDSSTGHTNGLEFAMDTPAKVVNDRTMIPVRAASEALKCTVGWDGTARIVTINSPDYVDPNPTTPTTPTPPTTQTPTGAAVNVTGVTVPKSKADKSIFNINASGVIEKFECFMLGDGTNRLVVDIYNGTNAVANTNITETNSAVVTAIRSGQTQTEPVKIARVVLDLTAKVSYSATLSADKKSVVVSFDSNRITDLTFATDGMADRISVHGESAPALSVFTLTNPDRLIIDIPNSEASLNETYDEALEHIDVVRTGQSETGATRIILELNKYISYKVETGTNSATVVVEKSTLDNIIYDSQNKTLVLKNVEGLQSEDFSIKDNYREGKYIISLPGNYKNTYGYGIIQADDTFVSTIEVKNNNNNTTEIIVSEKAIIASTTYVDDEEIRIKFVNPKEVYGKIVVLDAGHGATDPGTSGNGLTEKNINLDIMMRVYKLLENDPSIKVYATRVEDTYPTNIRRAQMGNEAADLFISIHQNAVDRPAVRGTEVLYAPHANDTTGKLTSKIAAQFMQNYVVSVLGTENRGIKNRPDLIVLNQTKVPAILIETLFISNPDDANIIKQEEMKQKLAESIYSATVDMLNQYSYR